MTMLLLSRTSPYLQLNFCNNLIRPLVLIMFILNFVPTIKPMSLVAPLFLCPLWTLYFYASCGPLFLCPLWPGPPIPVARPPYSYAPCCPPIPMPLVAPLFLCPCGPPISMPFVAPYSYAPDYTVQVYTVCCVLSH